MWRLVLSIVESLDGAEPLGDPPRLDAELRHGRVLPEPPLAQRPDECEPPGGGAVGCDQPPVLVGVEPEPEGVRPDRAAFAERADQGSRTRARSVSGPVQLITFPTSSSSGSEPSRGA